MSAPSNSRAFRRANSKETPRIYSYEASESQRMFGGSGSGYEGLLDSSASDAGGRRKSSEALSDGGLPIIGVLDHHHSHNNNGSNSNNMSNPFDDSGRSGGSGGSANNNNDLRKSGGSSGVVPSIAPGQDTAQHSQRTAISNNRAGPFSSRNSDEDDNDSYNEEDEEEEEEEEDLEEGGPLTAQDIEDWHEASVGGSLEGNNSLENNTNSLDNSLASREGGGGGGGGGNGESRDSFKAEPITRQGSRDKNLVSSVFTTTTTSSQETRPIANTSSSTTTNGKNKKQPYYNLSRAEERKQFMDIMSGNAGGNSIGDDVMEDDNNNGRGSSKGGSGGGNSSNSRSRLSNDQTSPLFEAPNTNDDDDDELQIPTYKMRSRDTVEDYGGGNINQSSNNNHKQHRTPSSSHNRNNSQTSFNPFEEEDDDSGLFGGENDHQNSGGEKFASMQELLEDEKSRNSHSVLNSGRGGRRRCCGGRRRRNGGGMSGMSGSGGSTKGSRRKKLCCLLLLLLLLGGIIGVILYFTLGKKNDTTKDGIIKGSEMGNTVPGEPPSPNGAPSRPNTPSVGEPVDGESVEGGAPSYPPNEAPTESPFSAKLGFTISFTKSPTTVGSPPPMESPKDVTWAPTISTTTSSGDTVSGGSGIVAPTGPPNWILPQEEEVPTFPPQLNSVEVPTKLPSLPTMSPMQELVFGNAGTFGPEPTERPSISTKPSIGKEIVTLTFMPNAMPSRGGLPTDIPTSSSMPSVSLVPTAFGTINGTVNNVNGTLNGTAAPTTSPAYNVTTDGTELTNATEKELACPDSSNPSLWTEMTLDEDDLVLFRYAIVLPEGDTTSTPSKEGGILCAHIESLSEAYLAIAISPSRTMNGAQAIIGLPDEGSVKKYWLNDGSEGVSDRGAYAMEEERQTLLFASIEQVEVEEDVQDDGLTGDLNDNNQVVQEEVVVEDGSIEGGGTISTGGELNDAPTLEEVVVEDGSFAGDMTTTTQVPPREDGEATVVENTMDNRHMQELPQQQQQAEVGTTLQQSSTSQIKTIMTFAKYLTEPNEHEILLSGTNAFLYSVGSSNDLGYHASRGSFTLDFAMVLPNNVEEVMGNETDVGDIMLNMTVNGTDVDNNETSYGDDISNNTQSPIVSSSITPMDYGAQSNDQCVEFCYSENDLSMLAPQVEEGSCSEMGYDSVVELNKIIIQEPTGGSSSLDVPIRLNVDIYQAPIVPVATVCNEGEVIVHALNEDATNYGASKSENNEQCVQSCLKDFLVNSNSPAKPRGFNEGSCEEMGYEKIVEGGNVVQPAGTIFPLTVDIFEKDMPPQAQPQQQQSSVCEENSVLVYALNADATNYGAINYNQCVESCLAQFIWLSAPQGVQEGSCSQQGFDELVQKDKVVEPEGFLFPLTVSIYDMKEEEVVNQGRECSEGFVLVHVANTIADNGNAGAVYQEDSEEPTLSPTILNGTATPTSSSSSLSNISSPTLPPSSNAPAASPDSTQTYSPTSSPITNDEFGSSNNETQPPILSTTTYAMLDQLSNPYTMSTTLEFDTQRSRYGSSVAISNTNGVVAVGARDGENENGVPTGAVYLYKLSDSDDDDGTNKLTLLQVLYGNAPKDQFGNAISMSSDGQRIIVGSRREDDQRGAARVYERRLNANNGALEWVLMEDEGGIMMGEGSGARGGWSVAISPGGDVVALGSPKGGAEGGGSVQTFKYDSGLNKWQPFGSTIEGIREATGYSLSLGGGTDNGSYVMIVGSAKTGGNAGKISMYTIDDNSGDSDWVPLGQEINGQTAGDTDGTSVAMSEDGTVVIVGGKGRNKLDAITGKEEMSSVGYCRVYKYQQSSWELQHTIVGEVANERLGSAVGVSSDGNVVACGGVSGSHDYSNNNSGGDSGDPSASAAGAATVSGVVRLYNMATQTESTLWPRGEATIVDGSTFGSTVALSSDGGQVVVGAPEWTNPSVTKDDGPFAGAIQIFQVPV